MRTWKDLKYKNYVTEHHNKLHFFVMSRRHYQGSALNYKLDGRENSCSAFSEIVSQYFFCHVYKYPTVSCRSRFSSRFTLRRWVLFARVFRTLKTLEGWIISVFPPNTFGGKERPFCENLHSSQVFEIWLFVFQGTRNWTFASGNPFYWKGQRLQAAKKP